MKPYHLFREKEACFAYHLDSGRFIRVSPAAYELLELRETMSAADAAAAFCAKSTISVSPASSSTVSQPL